MRSTLSLPSCIQAQQWSASTTPTPPKPPNRYPRIKWITARQLLFLMNTQHCRLFAVHVISQSYNGSVFSSNQTVTPSFWFGLRTRYTQRVNAIGSPVSQAMWHFALERSCCECSGFESTWHSEQSLISPAMAAPLPLLVAGCFLSAVFSPQLFGGCVICSGIHLTFSSNWKCVLFFLASYSEVSDEVLTWRRTGREKGGVVYL